MWRFDIKSSIFYVLTFSLNNSDSTRFLLPEKSISPPPVGRLLASILNEKEWNLKIKLFQLLKAKGKCSEPAIYFFLLYYIVFLLGEGGAIGFKTLFFPKPKPIFYHTTFSINLFFLPFGLDRKSWHVLGLLKIQRQS